jgi:hypothetical protein
LAASQNAVDGVLTCINAGRQQAEATKLWGEVNPSTFGERQDAVVREYSGMSLDPA